MPSDEADHDHPVATAGSQVAAMPRTQKEFAKHGHHNDPAADIMVSGLATQTPHWSILHALWRTSKLPAK